MDTSDFDKIEHENELAAAVCAALTCLTILSNDLPKEQYEDELRATIQYEFRKRDTVLSDERLETVFSLAEKEFDKIKHMIPGES